MSYYVHRAGQTLGPYSPENLVLMLRAHQLGVEDLAVEEGCEDWAPLGNIVDPALLADADMSETDEASERVFYASQGVTVTISRFIVGNQTFAMRNISSVRMKRLRPSRVASGLGLFIGLVCAISKDDGARWFGVFLSIVMILILIAQATRYAVVLTASSGEVRALASTDRQSISEIVGAINEAIVARS
jgi:hypothetical protein